MATFGLPPPADGERPGAPGHGAATAAQGLEPLPPEVRVRRPEWVAHVLDEDRAVLLHLPSGRRVVLSPEATAIWQEVLRSGADGVSAAEVTAAIAPRYAAEPREIAHDVAVLLSTLLDEQLAEPVTGSGAAEKAPAAGDGSV